MPDKFSLKNHPEIAQEIGFLIMVTANLEGLLVSAFTELLRGKSDIAYSIASRVENISPKFEMLVDMAKAREGVPLSQAVISLSGEVRNAIKFRNQIAHGSYVFDDNGNLTLVPFPFSAKRPTPKEIQLGLKTIRRHTDNLGKLIKAISELSSPSALMTVIRER